MNDPFETIHSIYGEIEKLKTQFAAVIAKNGGTTRLHLKALADAHSELDQLRQRVKELERFVERVSSTEPGSIEATLLQEEAEQLSTKGDRKQ